MTPNHWSHIGWATTSVIVTLWVGQAVLGLASPIPFGDESAHLQRLFEFRNRLDEFDGIGDILIQIFIASDAYPNIFYAYTLPFLDNTDLIGSSRYGMMTLSAFHAAIGITLGAALWGRPAAIAYVVLSCFSPIFLAHQQTYFIDVALTSWLGMTLLFAEASTGFKHRVWTPAFVITASISLLTKWTALIWLMPVTVWMCWTASTDDPPDRRPRVHRLFVMAATAALGGAAIWFLSVHPWVQAWDAVQPMAHLPLWPMALGLGLGTLGLSITRSRSHRCLVSIISILLLAGPWYAFRMGFLLERLVHESGVDILLMSSPLEHFLRTRTTVLLLIPAGLAWILISACLWLKHRTHGEAFWVRLVAVALGTSATYYLLPFNVRYLLPLAPLLAGASVATWGAASTRQQWSLALIGVALTSWTVQSSPHSRAIQASWSTQVIEVANVIDLPSGIGSPPQPIKSADVQLMLDTLKALCSTSPCKVNLTERQGGMQPRALGVLGAAKGLWLDMQPLCDGPEIPIPNQTLTVCGGLHP